MEQNERLGQLLVQTDQLTQDQLDLALDQWKSTKQGGLLSTLVEMGFLSFNKLSQFVEKSMGMKTFVIANRSVDEKILGLVRSEVMKRELIFPIGIKESSGKKYLILGVVDPLSGSIVQDVEKQTGITVYPVLISKPDFQSALKNHSRYLEDKTEVTSPPTTVRPQMSQTSRPTHQTSSFSFSGTEVDIGGGTAQNQDPVVIIRPGGYEEEIQFEKTRSVYRDEPQKTQVTGDVNLTTVRGRPEPASRPYIGENQKRFREEILAKLDISPGETAMFKQESYTRELLVQELREISSKVLEQTFENLSPDLKVEALINTLIEKGLISKRDLFNQGATSFVFSSTTDNKKSNL